MQFPQKIRRFSSFLLLGILIGSFSLSTLGCRMDQPSTPTQLDLKWLGDLQKDIQRSRERLFSNRYILRRQDVFDLDFLINVLPMHVNSPNFNETYFAQQVNYRFADFNDSFGLIRQQFVRGNLIFKLTAAIPAVVLLSKIDQRLGVSTATWAIVSQLRSHVLAGTVFDEQRQLFTMSPQVRVTIDQLIDALLNQVGQRYREAAQHRSISQRERQEYRVYWTQVTCLAPNVNVQAYGNRVHGQVFLDELEGVYARLFTLLRGSGVASTQVEVNELRSLRQRERGLLEELYTQSETQYQMSSQILQMSYRRFVYIGLN